MNTRLGFKTTLCDDHILYGFYDLLKSYSLEACGRTELRFGLLYEPKMPTRIPWLFRDQKPVLLVSSWCFLALGFQDTC